jgi:4-carboxymuconolactone decarboxylase
MPRIPYPDPAALSPEVRAAIGERPANVSLMMAAASEPVFHGLGQLGSALIGGSPLPANLRELAILRAGYMSGSAYEVFQHEALARHIGMTDAWIEAVRAGDTAAPALDPVERDVLAFVEDMVAHVRAGDPTLAAVRRHLDSAQVVDLIVVTGYYMMVCRLLETCGVELDSAPIDWNALVPAR